MNSGIAEKKRFYRQNRICLFILLAVFFLTFMLTAVAIIKGGDQYTVRYDYFSAGIKINNKDVVSTLSEEGIVKINKTFVDENNKVCVDLEAVKPGKTVLKTWVIYHDPETGQEFRHPMEELPVTVTKNKVIIEEKNINFYGYKELQKIILSCLFVTAVFMAVMFVRCVIRGYYSYTMVIYGGLALYLLAIVVYTGYDLSKGYAVRSTRIFLNSIHYTGFYFPLIAVIPMMFIAIVIALSNIWLIRHEGFRPVNMLGIIFGIVLFFGNVIVYAVPSIWYHVGSPWLTDLFTTLNLSFAYLMSFMEILFLFIMITAVLSTLRKPAYDKDYIIILGCRIRKDGTPTPLLKGRIDAALRFEKEQFEKTGKHAKFVPSGGQGPDEVVSESECMKNYLMEQGIPENMILMDDKSTNTWQNIKYSANVISADAGEHAAPKVAFSTTNYHVFRGYTLSQEHGLDAQGISAKTKLYFFPNAFLREFVGLLVAKKFSIGFTTVMIMAASAVVTLVL